MNIDSSILTRAWRPTPGRAGWIVTAAALLSATSMLVFGLWALFDSTSFVQYVNYFPNNEHLVRDAGCFQVGIGAALLAALVRSDGLLVSLAGFIVASALHTASHYIDRHGGGHDSDVPLLAVFTVVALIGLAKRCSDLTAMHSIDTGS